MEKLNKTVVEFIRTRDDKAANEPEQEQRSFTDAEVASSMRGYVGMQHGIMLFLLIAFFALGGGIVYQGTVIKQKEAMIAQLQVEKNDIILENVRLNELVAPIQKKIRLGAKFIHDKHHVPMDVALGYAHSEMVEALKTDLPFSVGLAVTSKESEFKSRAISYTGCCIGHKQINYAVWKKEIPSLTKRDLYDPDKNVALGYRILRQYVDRTGSLPIALQRYYGSTVREDNVAYADDVIRRSRIIARALSG